MKKGDRVGVIESMDDKEVKLFGYGVYEGDEIHPVLGFPNPKIRLDSGAVVWGMESWWGPESNVQNEVAKRERDKIVEREPTQPKERKP